MTGESLFIMIVHFCAPKKSAILQYNLISNMSFVISNFRHYCKAYISLKIRGKYITKNTKCYLCNRLFKFLIIKSDWTAKSDGFCRTWKWTLRPVFFISGFSGGANQLNILVAIYQKHFYYIWFLFSVCQ